MSRVFKPIHDNPDTINYITPDKVPARLDEWQQNSSAAVSVPLTLYIYRVPGKRDLFLTQHKIPGRSPTAFDVNGCLYYVRYDSWKCSDSTVRRRPVSHSLDQPIWTNVAGTPLRDQMPGTGRGTKMALVAVDLPRSDVRTVAVMLNPSTSNSPTDSLSAPAHCSSMDSNGAGNDLFVDLFSEAYVKFGQEISYSDGRAMTRRVFRPHAAIPLGYQFLSPWQGVISMVPHHSPRNLIQAFHERPDSPSTKILTSELRPNFGSFRLPIAARQRPQATLGALEKGNAWAESGVTPSRLDKMRHRVHHSAGGIREAFSNLDYNRRAKSVDLTSLDFSLAHEAPGGGAGYDPKLGKLVVYAEGQLCLDLVVASNLAVFHRMYERAIPHLHDVSALS